jgi:hypothetical protein
MKSHKNFPISIAIFLSLAVLTASLSNNMKNSNLDKATAAYKNGLQIMSSAEQSIFETMWANLFSIPRTTTCSKTNLKRRIRKQLQDEGLLPGQKIKKNKFWWVKQWGYGPIAYFFDYIDPVIRESVVNEFQSLVKDASAFPMESSDFSDPFDFKKLISQDNSNLSKKMLKKLQLFTKNYDASVYDVSVNTVQVRTAIQKWKWNVNPGDPSVYQRFVTKYDMNFDGRLNPREMILGSLYNNQQTVGSSLCQHCYFEVGKTLDAIFLYLDCDNDGLLTAEEIWSNLPSLQRNTQKWNIFSFGNDESIRTAAINDFILKNMKIKNGKITRNEFRVGLLLGIWDRQTEKTQIISDDGRNMKSLRWEENDMIDVALYNYYKKKMAGGK